MGKLRFFAQFKTKWADFRTQPQFLTKSWPHGEKTGKNQPKGPKISVFRVFGGLLNCPIAKMFGETLCLFRPKTSNILRTRGPGSKNLVCIAVFLTFFFKFSFLTFWHFLTFLLIFWWDSLPFRYPYFDALDQFRPILFNDGQFGPFWDILGHFGPFWAIFAILGHFGSFWPDGGPLM